MFTESCLSICIPTYNRAKILYKTLRYNLQYPEKDIEFVISDNASSDDTESIVQKLEDQRIRYFRNKRNLGVDLNILKVIERAKGKFILLLSDEDTIDLNVIDWIIEKIKSREDFSQILGKIGIKGSMNKDILYDYQCKNQILDSGYQSLIRLFFQHGYLSGIILKRDILNLKRAKSYVGSAYMHQVLMAQAMVKGKTICTPRIICYQNYESDISAVRDLNITIKSIKKISISPFSPLSRFTQMQFKRRLIYELLRNSPKTKEKLLNQERVSAAKLLAITFYRSPYLFLKLLPLILKTIDYSRFLIFWKHLPIQFIKYFYIMIIKNRKGLLMFFKELFSPNSGNIGIYPPWKHDKNIHG